MMSERCANTEALNAYSQKQEDEEKAYELLLEDLRDEENPEEYNSIIDSHGFGDADRAYILKDI